MAQQSEEWSSDVPPSLPEPPAQHRFDVPMMGFLFTENGMTHDISRPDIENMISTLVAADDPVGGGT